MRIHYRPDGTIYKTMLDRDVFTYDDPYGLALPHVTVDEVDPANKALCIDLLRTPGRVDLNGLNRYYIDTITGDIMERAGWTEKVEGIL